VIPSIGYDEVVLEAASPRNLAFGPARLMNAAGLGEPGNVVLAGHRTSWFLPLQDVRPGQEVVLEWRDDAARAARRRTYRVSETAVIDPRDLRFLQPTDEDCLTLITCYPFGRGPRSPQRYVVRATVEPRPSAHGQSRSARPSAA
jgi:sortase A